MRLLIQTRPWTGKTSLNGKVFEAPEFGLLKDTGWVHHLLNAAQIVMTLCAFLSFPKQWTCPLPGILDTAASLDADTPGSRPYTQAPDPIHRLQTLMNRAPEA